MAVMISLGIISLFAFKQLSPLPYFPTNKKDLPLILKNLAFKNNHSVVDLGAGDGSFIFAAAQKAYQKKLNTRFIAVEINPVLILILHLRRLFHPNKKNIKIVWQDMLKISFKSFEWSGFTTFYLYFSPWYIQKKAGNLISQLTRKNFSVISYRYPIPGWEKRLIKTVKGKNKIFFYQ